jgi:DNA/RNA-binding domain of Phe-tRNA-synthetase-like protein
MFPYGSGAKAMISIELPGVKLGLVEANEVQVELVREDLAQEMDAVCSRVRNSHTVEQVAELPAIRAVRAMFRSWGVDPSKYRPSAEALLRRVAQGKGLYRINNVVDVINLGSIETGWPYGLYDRVHFAPPVTFRIGQAGEMYEGIGRRMWHLEGRPVLADAQGPFGSPISDSTRTMVTESTRSALTVLFAPASATEDELMAASESLARRFEQFCSARFTRTAVMLP